MSTLSRHTHTRPNSTITSPPPPTWFRCGRRPWHGCTIRKCIPGERRQLSTNDIRPHSEATRSSSPQQLHAQHRRHTANTPIPQPTNWRCFGEPIHQTKEGRGLHRNPHTWDITQAHTDTVTYKSKAVDYTKHRHAWSYVVRISHAWSSSHPKRQEGVEGEAHRWRIQHHWYTYQWNTRIPLTPKSIPENQANSLPQRTTGCGARPTSTFHPSPHVREDIPRHGPHRRLPCHHPIWWRLQEVQSKRGQDRMHGKT